MNNALYVAVLSPGARPRTGRIERFVANLRDEHGLVAIVDQPAMLVLGRPGAAYRLAAGGKGIVWGRLYDRWSGSDISRVSEREELDDEVGLFVRRFWGGYVAIRSMDSTLEIFRDPSGDVPCYHADADGFQIFTSRPRLLIAGGLVAPAPDWTVLAQALAFRDLRPRRTALLGISELLPGEAARFDGAGRTLTTIWSPWSFTSPREPMQDLCLAAASLRRTSDDCHRAWRSAFARPLIEISGGLDSAIVAASLCAAGAPPAALSYVSVQGDPDERPFAHAIAAKLDVDLRMAPLDIGVVDLTLSDAQDLPRPCARNFAQALDRAGSRLAREIGSDAFFSGGGGDNVFCHLQSALPVLDRLGQEGVSAALRTAVDIARLSQVTFGEVLGAAIRRWAGKAATWPRPKRNSFVAGAAVAGLPWPDHPWLEAPAGCPRGKRRHVWSLIGIQNHLEGYGRLEHAPIVSPLLSQPLVEFCLGVPSWLWCSGGHNRAVARHAYRGALPDAVLARRTKGAFDSFGAQLIERNRAMIAAMLLDGRLAAEGLLDRGRLQRALVHPMPDGETIVELLALADMECWIGHWVSR